MRKVKLFLFICKCFLKNSNFCFLNNSNSKRHLQYLMVVIWQYLKLLYIDKFLIDHSLFLYLEYLVQEVQAICLNYFYQSFVNFHIFLFWNKTLWYDNYDKVTNYKILLTNNTFEISLFIILCWMFLDINIANNLSSHIKSLVNFIHDLS